MTRFFLAIVFISTFAASATSAATYQFNATLSSFKHDWIVPSGPPYDDIWGYAPTAQERAGMVFGDLDIGVSVAGSLWIGETPGDFEFQLGAFRLKGSGMDSRYCNTICFYGDAFVEFSFDLTTNSASASMKFDPAAPQTATFTYADSDDGTYLSPITPASYYSYDWFGTSAKIEITDFEEIPHMPLPGSAPFLAAGLGALVWLRRRSAQCTSGFSRF